MKTKSNTFRVSIFLAKRGILHGNRSVFFLSAAVIALLYINLLFIPSLMQGASRRVDEIARKTLTSDIVMTPAEGGTVDGAHAIVEKLSDYEGIEAATSTYQVGNRVTRGEYSTNSQIIAIDPSTYDKVFQNTLVSGAELSEHSDGILLGVQTTGEGLSSDKYAYSLKGGSVGDTASLQLQNGSVIDVPVEGIINNSFKQADSRTYITKHAIAAAMPTAEDKASTFYIKASDTKNVNKLLDSLRSNYPNYQFQLGTASSGIDDQVGTINLISAMLGVISLVVAAIMIFTVTYVDLANRRRLIGIERAIGITASAIQMSYVIRTIIAVFIGLTVGAIMYIMALIPLSQAYPFSFPNGPVSLTAQYGLMLRYSYLLGLSALIAALIPTTQILRAKIVDVIWGK